MICNEDVIQNLKDAGCNECLIKKIMNEPEKRQMQILSEHRRKLLCNLHKYQKQIDCLDFLIYKINK